MEQDSDLADKIKQLQRQIALNEQNQQNGQNQQNQDDQLKQFEKQLQEQEKKKVPVLTDPSQINTFLAIEEFLQTADKESNKEYFLKLLSKKQKLLNLVKQGKINPENYKNSISKINIQAIKDEKLVKCIKNQLILETKFGNTQAWFTKLVQKLQSTLNQQQIKYNYTGPKVTQEVTKHQIPIKTQQVKKQVVPINNVKAQTAPIQVKPQTKAPQNKQQQLIQKLDNQSIQKKLQIILRGTSKVQSLLIYYKQNLSDSKQKQIKEVLLPKRELCLKIVKGLLENKNIPIGKFHVTQLNRIDFEQFHGYSRKQFQNNLQGIIKKYKIVDKNEKQFKKKCSRSANQNNNALNKSNQLLKMYQSDLEYLNSIKNKDFIPLPLSRLSIEERQCFSENLKLQKNDIQILIKKIQGLSDNAKLKIYFEDLDHPRTEFQVNNGDQKIQFKIKTTQSSMKQIHKKNLRLKFEIKKMMFFTSQIGTLDILFNQFFNKNCIQGTVQSNQIKVTYQINIRLPRNRISKIKLESISIKRFPEYIHTQDFEISFIKKYMNFSTVIPPQPSNIKPSQQQQIPSKTQPVRQQSKTQVSQKLFYVERNEQVLNKLKQLKIQNLSQDYILRPQIYSDCLIYLQKQDQALDKAANQIYSFKKNKQLIEEIQDQIMKKKMFIQAKRKNGGISDAKYKQLLEKNLAIDQMLLQAYTKAGIETFKKFINTRIQIIKKQLSKLSPVNTNKNIPSVMENKVPQKKQNQQKGIDLTPFSIVYAKRTAQNRKILENIKSPIDMIQVDKIQFPQKYCSSLKFLTDFDTVLDAAINQASVGDKFNKKLAQQLQDQVMKNKALIGKKKGTITPEQYKAFVKNGIQLDKKLLKIYKNLGLNAFQKFIYGRLKVSKQEIGEQIFLQAEQELKFNINQQRELADIRYTDQILKIIQKFKPEFKFPESPQNCQCMTYIEKMLEVSKNPKLREKLEAVKSRFQKEGQEGTLDMQKYMTNLKKAREQDILRLQMYKKLGLQDHFYFVKARIKLVDQELASMQQA